MTTMTTEQHAWGTRLVSHPFPDMYIQADISKRPKQGLDVRFFFSGTIVQTPLRSGDILIWMEHMRAMLDAAKKAAS